MRTFAFRRGLTKPSLLVVTLLLAGAGCATSALPPPRPVLEADPLPTVDGDPGQGATELDRGIALVQNERFADGIAMLERAIKSFPNDSQAVYHLGYAYDRTGRRREAEEGYQRALVLDPKLVSARINLGAIYLEQPQQPVKAIAALEPAIALEPKAVDLRLNLAFAYRLTKNLDKAAEHYRVALQVEDRLDTRQMLADVLFDAGKKSEAVVEMKKLLPNFSKNVKALGAYGARFAKAGAYDDCVATFTKAIALDGKDASLWLNRGLCRHELKEPEAEVAADYERAAELDPNYQPAHYYVGMALLAAKKRAKAAEAFERAYKLGRDTPVGVKAKERWDELSLGNSKHP
jgi:tetratricopeptide (TPR) repeat protein